MIEGIKEIGEYEIRKGLKIKDEELKKISKEEKIRLLVDNTLEAKKVICVKFEWNSISVKYKGVDTEFFDSDKITKYLYRFGSGRGVNFTPTAKVISKKNKTPTFKNKILAWFKNHKEEDNLIDSIRKIIQLEKFKIDAKVNEKYAKLKKEDRNCIITIKIIENNSEKYIGEYDSFKKILIREVERSFYFSRSKGSSKGLHSQAKDKICSLCGKATEVYGFASPFSFSTVDKRGFSPHFIQADAWKQFPVCYNCAMKLNVGKQFLDKYLDHNFYGFKYYIIPNFVFSEAMEKVIKIIKEWKRDVSFRKKYINAIMQEEEDILNILKEQSNTMTLTFLFYRKKGGGQYQDILMTIEGVLPSWLKILFEAKREAEKKSAFKGEGLKKIYPLEKLSKNMLKFLEDVFGNNWESGIKFNFGIVRKFFPSKPRTTGIYNKYFLDIVGDILAGRSIDESILMVAFMREARQSFRENNDLILKSLGVKSLLLLSFLDYLKQIRRKNMENEVQKKIDEIKPSEKISKFFEEFKDMYDNPVKKGVFLEGVLTEFLIERQSIIFGSAPFREKLYELDLDEGRIKRLFPQIVEKLWEYEKLGQDQYQTEYRWLQELVSKYLNEAGENWDRRWKILRDGISYYFTLGLTLARIFKVEK